MIRKMPQILNTTLELLSSLPKKVFPSQPIHTFIAAPANNSMIPMISAIYKAAILLTVFFHIAVYQTE